MSNKPDEWIALGDAKIVTLFWSKVERSSGCWLWTGTKAASGGYGIFWENGNQHRAHRLSWLLTNGAIPKGMVVCHKCDNPPCVNPAHLFIGTMKDNVDDMMSKGRHHSTWDVANQERKERTHCRNGHEFTPENTYTTSWTPKERPDKHRQCRKCSSARVQRWRLKRKAKPSEVAKYLDTRIVTYPANTQ